MIPRGAQTAILQSLHTSTAVVLTGLPRVGRTTLAGEILADAGEAVVTINLEDPEQRDVIANAPSFLADYSDHLVILDNISGADFESVGRLVREASQKNGQPRFLLLPGQLTLSHNLAQKLTGLGRCVELSPIQPHEAAAPSDQTSAMTVAQNEPAPQHTFSQQQNWLRGGLPDSLLAHSDDASFRWRAHYLGALIGGDFQEWGVEAADRLPDVLAKISECHGEVFNEDSIRRDLGLDRTRVRRTFKVLDKVGILRQLPNRSGPHPVLYIRDSGLLHVLQGIRTLDQLRAARVYGHSWEGYAIEALVHAGGEYAKCTYYRDRDQNEVDLVLDFRPLIDTAFAFECKVDGQAAVKRGFWEACAVIEPTEKFVVHAGDRTYDRGYGLRAIPLQRAIGLVQKASRGVEGG